MASQSGSPQQSRRAFEALPPTVLLRVPPTDGPGAGAGVSPLSRLDGGLGGSEYRSSRQVHMTDYRGSRAAGNATRRMAPGRGRQRGQLERTRQHRSAPRVQWGFGAQTNRLCTAAVRLVPITASFSGYEPLPTPAAGPMRGGPGGLDAVDLMPLAFSHGRGWLSDNDVSLRHYAELYADTHPRAWDREDYHSIQRLPSLSPVRRNYPKLVPELAPEPAEIPSPSAGSPAVSADSHCSGSPASSGRSGMPAGKLWKLVQAKHKQIARMNSREIGDLARSWVDIERDKAATSIQSYTRRHQARARLFEAKERMVSTVIGLQRMWRINKIRGPPPAMLWTATLAMLVAKEEREAKQGSEKQMADDPVQSHLDTCQEATEAPQPEPEEGNAEPRREGSQLTPNDLVREFLTALPRETSDVEVTAVVTALKAARLKPVTWVDELREMGVKVLEEYFLPACVKKLHQHTEADSGNAQ